MNGKIAVSACLVIIFSFSVWVIFVNFFPDYVTLNEREFFIKKVDLQKSRIFLLGASGVGSLNTTMINQEIGSLSSSIIVYNLAKGGDLPEKRIHTLNEIINQKPELIVYGIDFRDFESEEKFNLLPSPNEFIADKLSPEDYSMDPFLFNPRLVTQQAIQRIANEIGIHDEIQDYTTPYAPLISLENLDKIASEKELESEYKKLGLIGLKIDNSTNNKNLQSLKKMIKTFQENNIKIVLFTIPHHKNFFYGLNHIEEEKFENILKSLEEEYKIDVYFINHKYENLPIWANVNHVAYNTNAVIYTKDVISIILNQIN